jgi:hypothetical protein
MKDLIASGASVLAVPIFLALGAIGLWAVNSVLANLRLPILPTTTTDYLLAGVIACLVFGGVKEDLIKA